MRKQESENSINRHNDFDHEFSHGSSNFSDRDTSFPDRLTGRGDIKTPERDHGGHYGKVPKGWSRSDEHLKEEVSEALYRNQSVDATDIEVSAKDGIITLSGTVDSPEAKRVAESCAQKVSGIEDVLSHLSIRRNEASSGRFS